MVYDTLCAYNEWRLKPCQMWNQPFAFTFEIQFMANIISSTNIQQNGLCGHHKYGSCIDSVSRISYKYNRTMC